MKIQFQYFAQLRLAAGVESESIELPSGASLQAAVLAAAEKHGDGLRKIALTDAGQIRPSLIVLVNDAPAGSGATTLKDGDRIAIFSPVAGG